MRTIAVTAALLLSTSIAAAQAPGETTSWAQAPETELTMPEPAPQKINYRGQLLMADGLAVAAIGLSPMLDSEPGAGLAALGVAGFALGAPLVHLAHGRGGAALKSFGLRTVLPMTAMLVGFYAGPNDIGCVQASHVEGDFNGGGGGCNGSISGGIAGLLLGSVGAVILDAKYLGEYEVARPSRWTAQVGHVQGGMTVGVGGAF